MRRHPFYSMALLFHLYYHPTSLPVCQETRRAEMHLLSWYRAALARDIIRYRSKRYRFQGLGSLMDLSVNGVKNRFSYFYLFRYN